MALKTYRPTSAGLRHLVLVDRSHLWKGAPVKMLTEGKSKSGGRNNSGRITTRHVGGGHKQSYRLVDFRRRKHDVTATVERLEYDPNRTAFIALLKYTDGELAYILADSNSEVVFVGPENLERALAATDDGTTVRVIAWRCADLPPGVTAWDEWLTRPSSQS